MALLNVERAGAGLRPLRLDVRLIQAPQEATGLPGADHPAASAAPRLATAEDAQWLAPGGATLPGRALAEPATPAETVAQWLITAHDMLLDPQYTDAGVGVGVIAGTPGQGQEQVYWTETLGASGASAVV